MTKVPPVPDLARLTLSVLAIAGLILASFLVLLPFLPALVWGVTIVVATWPALLRLQSWFGGRRSLAVALMTIVLLAVVVVPLYIAISTIVESAAGIGEWVSALGSATLPPPPDWVASIPLTGPKLAAAWLALSQGGLAALGIDLEPYVSRAVHALASQAGSFGATVVQFIVTVVIAAMLYGSGESAGLGTRRFFRRLAGQRGDGAVVLAGKAIRAVALGVMVTALIQTVLSGVGLAIAGVPHAGLLTAVVLVLCVAQLGPALVLIPAVIWLFWSGRTGMGVFAAVWSIMPLGVDNILRPLLIKRGANLPLWLVLAGVLGGLISFGVIGLFTGPVVLAVTYTLVQDWVADLGPEAASTPQAAPRGESTPGLGDRP
jgi:predicted PurR-regulated permease PerM